MPYLPTDWKDRAVDSPMTYTMQDNGDGTITLIPAEGNIAEVGTPLTAANLNHIEAGIQNALRTDEVGNMNGNQIQNVKLKLTPNIFGSSGGAFDASNSDFINLNSLWWADTLTGDAEAMLFPRSATPATPAGSVDTNDYDALRVLNGQLLLNSVVIGSTENTILWTGGYYLTSTQKITPSKTLQNCANGWALVWSDYDVASTTTNNSDFVYTLIPKNAVLYDVWHQALMAGYSTATTVTINAKQYAYTNTQVWGADINNSANAGNNNQDVVLRYVVEF
jgi:hypothetical protein